MISCAAVFLACAGTPLAQDQPLERRFTAGGASEFRIQQMHAGTIVEQGDSEQVFNDPQHDYTRRLLGAVPQPDPGNRV